MREVVGGVGRRVAAFDQRAAASAAGMRGDVPIPSTSRLLSQVSPVDVVVWYVRPSCSTDDDPLAEPHRVEALGGPAAVVVVLTAQRVEALPDVERVEVAGALEVVEERPARRGIGHGDQVREERDLQGGVVQQHPRVPVEAVPGLQEDPGDAVRLAQRIGQAGQAEVERAEADRRRSRAPCIVDPPVVSTGSTGAASAARVSRTRSMTPTMSPTVASGLSRVSLRNWRPSTFVAATIARPDA